jgi:8-oxo-dGTP pyrophosphatase MutT (NUDIX family)
MSNTTDSSSTSQEHPWRTLASRQVLDTPYLRIRSEKVELPGGTILDDYYIIENRGWVGIVPVTADGRFLINKQYKHGIGMEVLEFPAGGIDPNEDAPLLTAHRELMEETGYSVEDADIEPLAQALVNPTGAVTRAWWFLARNVRKTGMQKVDPAEVIENRLVTASELLTLIRSGQFAVSSQVAAAYQAFDRLGFLRFQF